MSTETGSSHGADRSSDDERSIVHTSALAEALRASLAFWGFALLMVVFTGISLGTSVYTSVVYPVFFGLCAAASLAVAAGRTYSKYGYYSFERNYNY